MNSDNFQKIVKASKKYDPTQNYTELFIQLLQIKNKFEK